MIVLKIKTNNGDICDMHVAELLGVDGKKYTPSEDQAFITNQLSRLTGRVDSIEAAIFGRREPEPQEDIES